MSVHIFSNTSSAHPQLGTVNFNCSFFFFLKQRLFKYLQLRNSFSSRERPNHEFGLFPPSRDGWLSSHSRSLEPNLGATGSCTTARPLRRAAQPAPGIRLPRGCSGLPAGFSARIPNAKNLIVGSRRGRGKAARKTHPSGRGRDNFPGSRGPSADFFPQTLLSRGFPLPSSLPPPPGARTGRRAGSAGGARAAARRPGGGEAGIPAWRTRGPSGPGTRSLRPPARRRSSAFLPGGPQARLKIGASVTPGPSPADLALERRPPGGPGPRSQAPRRSPGRAGSGP